MNKTIVYMISVLFLGMLIFTGCTKSQPSDSNNIPNVSGDRQYVNTNPDQCAATDWICENDMQQFYDDTGCGCEPKPKTDGKLQATDCTDPRPEACTLEYAPVCGWFDSTQIQCIKYPCAATYGNACGACADTKVISWTQGECPE